MSANLRSRLLNLVCSCAQRSAMRIKSVKPINLKNEHEILRKLFGKDKSRSGAVIIFSLVCDNFGDIIVA